MSEMSPESKTAVLEGLPPMSADQRDKQQVDATSNRPLAPQLHGRGYSNGGLCLGVLAHLGCAGADLGPGC